MNILILGSGGREHALAWAVLQNPKCDRLIVAPGNGGIGQIADCAAIDPDDAGAVLDLCAEEAIDFVIIGPEAPLAAGVADALRDAGILTFGPSRAAAELEASIIVVAASGKSAVDRMFLGSTTTRLATASPVPVLVMPETHTE